MISHKNESKKTDTFSENLQELVIRQTRELLNQHIYTKSLLSTLPVAFIATDVTGSIKTFNKSAEEIFKISTKKVLNKHITTLFKHNSPICKRIDKSLKSGKQAHISSETLVLNSGISLHGNIYIQPIFDDEQETCGLVLSLEDLTYVNFLHHAFRRYVPPAVSEIIACNPEKLKLGGEVKNLTVLFSDLVGFTPLAEQLKNDDIITQLSSYFDDMTEEIFKYNGTLKEYSGDEIMAIFGAPVDMENHAGNACSTALSMQNKLDLFHKKLQSSDKNGLKSRIGINTGDMLVGNIGSKYRFSYGVIGDHVNLASRLEGLCKIYGVRILVSEHTIQKTRTPFVFREIDHIIVRGREQSTRIYELMADDSKQDQFIKQIRLYQRALTCYKSGDFQSAAILFESVLREYPDDMAARVMAKRSAEFHISSLSHKAWNGIYDYNKNYLF